ncbi:MAG TPA: RNA polymerase sigma factor [Mycobacteriales bacterium]|nr:RNA polymerase sigma factor [Mycobacteriales bacterium]
MSMPRALGAGDLGDRLLADPDGSVALSATLTREEGFRLLYSREFSGLAGYCTALVGDPQLGRDITQEAFARLFARWIGVREPKAYVYYVATNLARRHWRRGKREREIYAELHARPDAPAEHDPWLRDLVERLPGKFREVVLLHYYADLPLTEVAELTKRPVGTIKRWLHEARALLQVAMEADDA